MDTSMMLAQLLGAFYLVMGIGLLINRKEYERMIDEFYSYKPTPFLMGIILFFVGLLIIQRHNVWSADAMGLITLIAWVGLIKGALLLLFPGPFVSWARKFKKGNWYWACSVVALLFGAYLSYVGFLA